MDSHWIGKHARTIVPGKKRAIRSSGGRRLNVRKKPGCIAGAARLARAAGSSGSSAVRPRVKRVKWEVRMTRVSLLQNRIGVARHERSRTRVAADLG